MILQLVLLSPLQRTRSGRCEAFSTGWRRSTTREQGVRPWGTVGTSCWYHSTVFSPSESVAGNNRFHKPTNGSYRRIHRRGWVSSSKTDDFTSKVLVQLRDPARSVSTKTGDSVLGQPPSLSSNDINDNSSTTTSTTSDDDDPDWEAIQRLTETWRDCPVCNPILHCKTWIPTDEKIIHTILRSELTQPYLASQVPFWQHLHHHSVKLVRHQRTDDDDDEAAAAGSSPHQKMILLHPDTPSLADLPDPVRKLLRLTTTTTTSISEKDDSNPDDDNNHPHPTPRVTEGPVVPLKFTYHQFTAKYLLEHLLPVAVHPPPAAFETIGHVAHLNLQSRHVPYRHLIGQVLVATLPETIHTVVHKVGEVQGPHRTYALEVVAGRNDTVVQLQESGISLQFDLANVYWCSRLSNERQRLLREEILVKNGNQNHNQTIIVADPFCGVGALCLQAAAATMPGRDVQVWANDWNPHAVQALRDNAARNGLMSRISRMECGDAYDFLMDLGLVTATATSSSSSPATTPTPTSRKANSRHKTATISRNSPGGKPQKQPHRLPDHVVMNFPLSAPEFLGALRWWPASNTVVVPRVHVYTFARAAADGRSARDVAVDQVANQLIPRLVSQKSQPPPQPGTVQPSLEPSSRLQELNDEYGCQVRVHHVRDVAPGKMVYCVSFSATPKLLRCMQGDYFV